MFVWPRFTQWRQSKDLDAARRYEKEGDYRRALLALEQTVQVYPKNVEAKRRLADFYERTGERQALTLWQEAVRLEPENFRNLLGLAGAALLFGDLTTCRAALGRLRQAGKTDADYYRSAAGLALLARDNPELEENLRALAQLRPDDLRVQLNLAMVRLQSADGSRAETARADLRRLARFDKTRIRAIVELLSDVARRWPKPAVERGAALEDLARTLTPPLGPRLDQTTENEPIGRLIDFAMSQPAVEPEDAVALLNWMTRNGRAPAALEWIDRLPARAGDSVIVRNAVAETALQTGDLPRLRELLLAGVWGPVPSETVARAWAAHENDQRGGDGGGSDDWAGAIGSCQASLPGLQVLLRLTEAWNRPEARRQVLQAITRAFPRESWAWHQLVSYALAQRDADQLWQVYQRWSRDQPGDISVQTEAAIMGLLLQRSGVPGAAGTAEFVRLQPNNPGAAVAHALALWRDHQPAEAVRVLDAQPRGAFSEPRFALAYGLVLAEAGRAQESEQMLNRASAERLLPDEILLIEQARARNQPRLPAPAGP